MPLVSKNFSDIITFTRASTGTFFNSAGVLQTAAIDAPRFDYNPSTLAAQGLLIEEARTNGIRNNTMQGAVAGTPGTLPTNWDATPTGGVFTRTISGPLTENGITYLDYRYQFSAAGTATISWETATQIAALSGQTWTNSVYVKLASGSLSNLTCAIFIQENNSGGAGVASSSASFTPTGAALATQRVALTRTLTNATTAFVGGYVALIATGAADITLRIGLPQLEQGAFATSVIPTTTTALTRSADVASVNTLSPWYNSASGTLYAEYAVSGFASASAFPSTAALSDGTGNNRINLASTNTGASLYSYGEVQAGGAPQAGFYGASGSPFGIGTARKVAIAYAANDFAFTTQGLAVQTDTSGTVPTVDRLYLGVSANGTAQFQNGWLRRVSYFPRRLANAELVSLTT